MMKKIAVWVCIVLAMAMACTSAMADGVHVGTVTNANTVLCSKDFSQMVLKLSRGTRVLYWASGKDEVVKVVTQQGVVGYCYEGYLSSVAEVDKSEIVKTTGGSVDVYTSKNGKPVKVMTVSGTLPLVLCGTKGSWSKVKNLKGKVGYIKTEDLKKVW